MLLLKAGDVKQLQIDVDGKIINVDPRSIAQYVTTILQNQYYENNCIERLFVLQ